MRDLEISDAKIIYSYKVINIDDCIDNDVDNNKNIILINIQLWFIKNSCMTFYYIIDVITYNQYVVIFYNIIYGIK